MIWTIRLFAATIVRVPLATARWAGWRAGGGGRAARRRGESAHPLQSVGHRHAALRRRRHLRWLRKPHQRHGGVQCEGPSAAAHRSTQAAARMRVRDSREEALRRERAGIEEGLSARATWPRRGGCGGKLVWRAVDRCATRDRTARSATRASWIISSRRSTPTASTVTTRPIILLIRNPEPRNLRLRHCRGLCFTSSASHGCAAGASPCAGCLGLQSAVLESLPA